MSKPDAPRADHPRFCIDSGNATDRKAVPLVAIREDDRELPNARQGRDVPPLRERLIVASLQFFDEFL